LAGAAWGTLAAAFGPLSLAAPAAATLLGAALLAATEAGQRWPHRWAAAYGRGVAALLGGLALAGLALTAATAAGAVALGGRWGGAAERFGLHLALTPLNLYFLTLSFAMVALALLNFGGGALEERAAGGISAAAGEAGAAAARRRALLLFGLLMAALALCLGLFFATENIFLMFSAFEASALPIFLVVAFFGKRSQKFRASSYLLYFTLAGGLPLLTVLLTLYAATGSLLRPELAALLAEGRVTAVAGWEGVLFLACFLPFGVKLAFFPLHSWLPEAHVEASTEGSMLLSGILLKLGFFGLLQYCLGLWGAALFGVAPLLLTLALVGATATALATYRQLDLKKVIAYSSVVHMNLALFGYLTLAPSALAAALFLNFGHAVVSAGLFGAVGLLQDRSRSRHLLELSGLAAVLPLWSGALLLLLLANAGLPGTVGFVGEAPLLWGCFRAYPYAGLLLTLPTALMGLRCFLLHSQLCWGVAPAYLNPRPLAGGGLLLRSWDISPGGEGAVTLALAGASLLLGLWPSPLLGLLAPAAVGPLAALAPLAPKAVGCAGPAMGCGRLR
jgi:NADH-quinone oxidoreductase subunit M